MALRRRGKNNFYHVYFRTVTTGEDGVLRYAVRTINLHTADLTEARALEAEYLRRNRAARLHQRAEGALRRLAVEAGEIDAAEHQDKPLQQKKRCKRIALADAVMLAEKYRPISVYGRRIWNTFLGAIGKKYFDEVTPEIAFEYLSKRYANKSGKAYNNNLTALNQIFKVLLFETGMKESPFSRIPLRCDTPRHQRAFTENECILIIDNAVEPWKSAFIISYYTGFRQKDAFELRWKDIDGDLITVTPAKTSRYRRAVRLRIPRRLMDYLAKLPKVDDRVLGFAPCNRMADRTQRYFGKLLRDLGITASENEIVNYNSVRNTYISRLTVSGIDLKLIGGAVGHKDEEQTQLYNTAAIPADRLEKCWVDDKMYVKLDVK